MRASGAVLVVLREEAMAHGLVGRRPRGTAMSGADAGGGTVLSNGWPEAVRVCLLRGWRAPGGRQVRVPA